MDALDRLLACAGTWRGTSRLQDPQTGGVEDSLSVATVTPLLGDKFVRLDYGWAYRSVPQEGSFLIGSDPEASGVSVHWIDSWHMGRQVMACRGTAAPDGSLSVRGSYAVPSGPDWGWRITIRPGGKDALRVVMHNITPDGHEELAVEAEYLRADEAH